ncbi:hypothetical protein F4780DRAFT_777172 [Xylariomycetidae sp. FL0641]|nr:hypothetical protein F4780DRAFT_777172 [Xylariomycetidae sp. FL0641]
MALIATDNTKQLGTQHPVLLAGMGMTATADLAATAFDALPRRPMGIVTGLINNPDQSAKKIVDEVVTQAADVLGSAGKHFAAKPKL